MTVHSLCQKKEGEVGGWQRLGVYHIYNIEKAVKKYFWSLTSCIAKVRGIMQFFFKLLENLGSCPWYR